MRFLMLVLALFSLSANALELHFGMLTHHTLNSNYQEFRERTVEGSYTYERNANGVVEAQPYKQRYTIDKPFNENNELIMVFMDNGWGAGHMYNSFNRESWLVAKKFDFFTGTAVFNTKVKMGAIAALVSGYEQVKDYQDFQIAGLTPVAHAYASIEKGRFGVNTTATVSVVTVNGSIKF